MKMRQYKFEGWNVAYRDRAVEGGEDIRRKYQVIKNPALYWAADPFVIEREDKYYIFAELYNRITYKGRIGYCVISKDMSHVTKWRTAISAEIHLSFPYIFKCKGAIYIMPESCRGKDLRIYKCTRFPDRWVLDKKIMDNVIVADSIFLDNKTILSYNNIKRPREFLIFKEYNGAWENTAIQKDPEIKLRPAGKVYSENGEIFVPLQDSSEDMYGRGVSVYKLKNINDIGNKDNMAFQLNPDTVILSGLPFMPYGIHTFNFDGRCEVIDVKTYTKNIFSLIGYGFKRLKEKSGSDKK